MMLDELLGRAELKDRVAALEEEVERLESQLEAERDRRAAAVSDRQDAQERANRLEDRIADLEGQLEAARGGERALEYRGTEELRGGRRDAVLDRLASFEAPAEGALTAMVADGVPDPVREAFGERAALVRRAAPCLVARDDAGLVSVGLEPPLPPAPFVEHGDAFRIEPEWFRPTGEFGFALVRSDRFAYGAYEGDERVGFEAFESDVHDQHSKGGYSQARFERRRDEQIDAHLERVRETLAERAPDPLIVVGERTVVGEFADLARRTATVDASGTGGDALDDAFRSFWSATLYRF